MRIARYGFRYATRRRRRKITVFHKANIMKLTDGLFLNCARRIYEEEYPNIEYEEVHHRRRLHEALSRIPRRWTCCSWKTCMATLSPTCEPFR